MYDRHMPPTMKATLLERIADIPPRMADSPEPFTEPSWSGKYADVAHRYYNGLLEDAELAHIGRGVLLGYRIYAAVIAQVPGAILTANPDYEKNSHQLYSLLSSNLATAVGPVMVIPSGKNKKVERNLGLRHLPLAPSASLGYEFVRDQGKRIYRPKPHLLTYCSGEVDESELAASGLSYDEFKAKQREARCVMPWGFHQRVWDAMLATCIFGYQYINADIDMLRQMGPETEVQ